jgi:hypothetical protein
VQTHPHLFWEIILKLLICRLNGGFYGSFFSIPIIKFIIRKKFPIFKTKSFTKYFVLLGLENIVILPFRCYLKLYSSTVVEVFQIEFACSILRSSYLYLDFNDFKKITSRPP